MKYRSRISILLLAFIFSLFAFIVFNSGGHYLLVALILLIPFLLVLLMFASINYTIIGGKLKVKTMGIGMADIDISRIKLLRRSYNPLSSPASSLKRLEVVYYYSTGLEESVLISPINEHEFIEKLQDINPRIENRVTNNKSVMRFWDWDI